MKMYRFALAGASALAMAGMASAGLVGAKAVNMGDMNGEDLDGDTWQIFLIFDNALDQLLAINGDADVSALIFDSPVPLVQNNLFEGMSAFDDVPGAADLGGDSWVVLGSPDTHNTSFSPNFLGGDGMESVIKGNHFEQLDNGGYFDQDPGSAEVPDENMQIQIAQFTLAAGEDDPFPATYIGTASYNLAGGDLVQAAFSVPSPGALALLGLAGLAGGRRRRA